MSRTISIAGGAPGHADTIAAAKRSIRSGSGTSCGGAAMPSLAPQPLARTPATAAASEGASATSSAARSTSEPGAKLSRRMTCDVSTPRAASCAAISNASTPPYE